MRTVRVPVYGISQQDRDQHRQTTTRKSKITHFKLKHVDLYDKRVPSACKLYWDKLFFSQKISRQFLVITILPRKCFSENFSSPFYQIPINFSKTSTPLLFYKNYLSKKGDFH